MYRYRDRLREAGWQIEAMHDDAGPSREVSVPGGASRRCRRRAAGATTQRDAAAGPRPTWRAASGRRQVVDRRAQGRGQMLGRA